MHCTCSRPRETVSNYALFVAGGTVRVLGVESLSVGQTLTLQWVSVFRAEQSLC